VIDWICDNYIEITGAVTGLIYLYFSIKQKIWLWPVGLIASGFYFFVFYNKALYANMALQGYFIVMSIYGWYYWKKRSKKDTDQENFTSKFISLRYGLYFLIFGILVEIALWYILSKIPGTDYPFLDSLTTTLSIIGTWMLAKKYIENWILWIVADSIYVGLYVYIALYPTAILYSVYTILAITGYYTWKKLQQKNPEIS
jgi:nicotinamide mononucleotide transporter